MMNATTALKQYQNVNLRSQVAEASPHRLIQMLMEGALTRLAQARGAIEREQLAVKGERLGEVISIIGGLREGLDFEKGGEVALNLDNLYEYMNKRVLEANLGNDAQMVDEVAVLMRNVKQGWDAIAQ